MTRTGYYSNLGSATQFGGNLKKDKEEKKALKTAPWAAQLYFFLM